MDIPSGRLVLKLQLCVLSACGNQHDLFRKEGQLDTTFDIFKRLSDGALLWVLAIEGFEQATEQTSRLASIEPGEYFVYSQKKRNRVRVLHRRAGMVRGSLTR